MKSLMKPLAVAPMSIAVMFVGIANATGPITGPRIFPSAMPRQAIADGCGGLGSTIVKWVEESATKAAGIQFRSVHDVRPAIESEVEPKIKESRQALIRQYGGGPHVPQFVPPNLVIPVGNLDMLWIGSTKRRSANVFRNSRS